MAQVTVEQRVNAPIESVFASWHDEYSDIFKFNPNLHYSKLLSESPVDTGVGALRQCDMKDGKNWIREKIIQIEKNKRIVVDIYEGTMPLKSAQATFTFNKIDNITTIVSMNMAFEPKMGWLGKLMIPMMKKKFEPMLRSLLQANADYVERGVLVNTLTSAA